MTKPLTPLRMFVLPRFTYFGLLIFLVFFFIVAPFFSKGAYARLALDLSLMSLLALSVYICSHNKKYFMVALGLSFPALLRLFTYSPEVDEITLIFNCMFFVFTIIILLHLLFTTTYVTADVIYAAISVYFLLGVLYGVIFTLLEYLMPGSFSLPQHAGDVSFYAAFGEDLIYFSFVTLTTVGYGDIAPLSQPAKFLSILEAVTGQIYLTVMIARLIGIHIAQIRT